MNVDINEEKKTLQIEEPIKLGKLQAIIERYLPKECGDWTLIIKPNEIKEVVVQPVYFEKQYLIVDPYCPPTYPWGTPTWYGDGTTSGGEKNFNLNTLI